MKAKAIFVPVLCLLTMAAPAIAEIGTIDAVPAATLLVPYFEVDLGDPNGITTLFSINNAADSAALAHVTLWTDQSIPTLNFDVYLTGYDVQSINVRDIFRGFLPVTADPGANPSGTVSPNGTLSQGVNFPGSTGPCGSPFTIYENPALNATLIDHMRKSHTGLYSAAYGGCSGANYGDNIARGYITVDSVVACNLSFPSDPGYFRTLADSRNILYGDLIWVNPSQNFATGATLVHIESCPTPSVGSGAGHCPLTATNYTFYGRYRSVAGQDQREPLPTTFATRYINGGAFSGGTDLIVWRDTKTLPTAGNGPHSCAKSPSWFPLSQSDVVSFDETENVSDLCFQSNDVSPPAGGKKTCFPLATQRIHLAGGNKIGVDPSPPSPFGWIYLNLNYRFASGDPYPGRAQTWVITAMSSSGIYEVGYDAIALDNALTAKSGGVILVH